jgi:hypothetical protein
MDNILRVYYLHTLVAGALLAVLARLAYLWLLPKPLPNVPHNPITNIWGDIPDITYYMKGGKRTFGDYVADVVKKHGPLSQVSRTSLWLWSRK